MVEVRVERSTNWACDRSVRYYPYEVTDGAGPAREAYRGHADATKILIPLRGIRKGRGIRNPSANYPHYILCIRGGRIPVGPVG